VNVAVLVTLSFLTGCLTVFDAPARQALVMDTVPRELAPNAMALHATAVRLFLALGAFAAGALIPAGGVASCFVATTAMFVAAAGVTLPIRAASPARVVRAPVPQANDGVPHDQQALRAGQNGRRVGPGQRVTFAEALRQAGRLVFDVADLRTLVLAAVACEIFGFSFQTAVPAFARDVLGAGAEGLGTLNGATSLGGALAVVGLSLVPGRLPREPLLGLVFVVFGASMLVLAPAGTLVAAAAVLLVTGACSASFDVLQQTLMQLAVPEDQRGRAVGVWVLGIGSAPIGNLEMGVLVASLGAPMALAINGGLVLVAAATLLARAPGYRRILLRAPR
jgi:predicted MFS family arabinose efflux permease